MPVGSPLRPSPAAPPARRGPHVGKTVARGQIRHPETPNRGETPGCHRLRPACCAPSLAPHPRGCFEFLRRRNQSQALGCGARPSQERWRKPPPPLAGTIPPQKNPEFLPLAKPWRSRGFLLAPSTHVRHRVPAPQGCRGRRLGEQQVWRGHFWELAAAPRSRGVELRRNFWPFLPSTEPESKGSSSRI